MSSFSRLGRFGCRVAMILAGSGLFVMEGCDPAVRSTVLDGLQTASTGLAETFITAFFTQLETSDTTGTTTTPGT